MVNIMNDELFKNFTISCNHAIGTTQSYELSLRKYCIYFDMSLKELLEEAEEDEMKGVKWKHSRLKSKLVEYRHHMFQNYAAGTVRKEMNCIIFFYKFYDIKVWDLPKVNDKSIQKLAPIYFKDLPDKEVIMAAFQIASPLMKAIILFSCSSGCARTETLSLTIGDYIKALSEYLPNNRRDIFDVIDYLNDVDDVVPTFSILRKKTNKYYLTYCSPEAVKAINAYLLLRDKPITDESPLFQISRTYMVQSFEMINDTLGLGRVGRYLRFRSHMLRKFHASALYNDGMSIDKENDLQGKAKNKTDAAYFMTNPDDLKYEYIQHLPAVTINTDVEKLSIKSSQFIQMEKENEALKSEVGDMRNELEEMRGLKKELLGIINKVSEGP